MGVAATIGERDGCRSCHLAADREDFAERMLERHGYLQPAELPSVFYRDFDPARG